jgi:ubiquinone/menaquinone biosynthesis C-methylase UbiE
VIEHVQNSENFLKEINRVLSIGGTLILTAPQMGRLHGIPHDYYRFTKYGLTFLLESHGFKIRFLEPHGGFWRAMGSHFNFYLINTIGKNKIMGEIIRATIILPINFFAKILDRIFYWDLDTLGYNVIVVKENHHG